MSFSPMRLFVSGGSAGIAGSGSGAANRIAVWTDAFTLGSYSTLVYDGTTLFAALDFRMNQAQTSAAQSVFRNRVNDGSMAIYGGGATASAGAIFYGKTHATKADTTEFTIDNVAFTTITSAGGWVYSAGAVGAPAITTGSFLTTGIWFSSGMRFAAGGVDCGGFTTAGVWTIGLAAATVGINLLGPTSVTTTGTGTLAIIDSVAHTSTGAPVINWKGASTTIGQIGFPTANTFTYTWNVLSASGNFSWMVNSGAVGLIGSGGKWTVGAASGTQFHVVNGRGWDITFPSSGVTAYVQLVHSSNTANSGASFYAQVAGANAGDAFMGFSVSSVTDWSIGCDNSASDRFSISQSASLGSNEFFSISTAGIVTIGTGTATTHVLNASLATNASDALTLLNGPAGKAGNPAVYINITINGTGRIIPAW